MTLKLITLSIALAGALCAQSKPAKPCYGPKAAAAAKELYSNDKVVQHVRTNAEMHVFVAGNTCFTFSLTDGERKTYGADVDYATPLAMSPVWKAIVDASRKQGKDVEPLLAHAALIDMVKPVAKPKPRRKK